MNSIQAVADAPVQQFCFQPKCNHPADNVWSYGPGRFSSGKICDCCMVKIWEETMQNLTKSIAELEVKCPS